MRLICNRTQNNAIWGLIALFLTNQIAGNTIDFKMNVIKIVIDVLTRILANDWITCSTMFETKCSTVSFPGAPED